MPVNDRTNPLSVSFVGVMKVCKPLYELSHDEPDQLFRDMVLLLRPLPYVCT
eukprot:XP_001706807.1 Hypothetical protein GL50803_23697 [Giardia lamblia ATCC 50803]